MAIRALDPDDVLGVADDLAKDYPELDAADWESSDDARYRSSVSRAYYAVFLHIKKRLADVGYTVPGDNAHNRVRMAFDKALGHKHKIPLNLKSLMATRKDADYDLEGDFSRSFAESRCDASQDLIDLIEALSDSKFIDIGNRL